MEQEQSIQGNARATLEGYTPVGMRIAPITKKVTMTHQGSNTGYHAGMRCWRSAVSKGRKVCSERGTTESSSSCMIENLELLLCGKINA